MAHDIPYVATATVADLHDLEAKVERAMELRGARYLHVLVPCPLGWGSAPSDTIELARLAQETGIFPVFEARDGTVTAVSPIRRRQPVEDYLSRQGRYAHLFGEPRRGPTSSPASRPMADRNIARYGLLDPAATRRTGRTDDGAPVRHHPRRRLEPRQPHRFVAGRAPGLRPPARRRATAPARPARTSRAGSTTPSPATTRRRGGSWSRRTRCRRSWAASASTPARRRATGPSSTRPSASTRSSASSATWPSSTGGRCPGRARPPGSPGPGGRLRAGRARRRLPPAAPRPRRAPRRRGPAARRDDALRDPRLPAAPRRPGRRDPAHRRPGRGARARADGDRRPRTSGPPASYDAVFLAVGAQLARRIDIPAGDSSRVVDALSLLHGVADGRPAAARTPGRGLRRRGHRGRRGAHGPPPGRHRRRHRLPPHPGADARPRRGAGGRAGRGGHRPVAVHRRQLRRAPA